MPWQLALYPNAPLLDVRRRRRGIHGTNADPAEQTCLVAIQGICRESVLKKEERCGCGRGNGLHVVDQKGRVQRELIFAAESFKQQVIDSIPRPKDSFGIERVRQSDSRSKISFVDLHQRS